MRGIEHLRYEVDAAIELLTMVRPHLDDLHTLAYNRHRAASQDVKVSGGSHDYALDTHGDTQARDLLNHLSTETKELITGVAKVIREAKVYLTRSDVQRVHRRDGSADATLDEILQALRHARHRRTEGDTHALLVAAPVIPKGTDWQTRYETLASAVRKVTPRFAEDHANCTIVEGGRRRKLSRRYDLALLTPLERDVWRESLSTPQDRKTA